LRAGVEQRPIRSSCRDCHRDPLADTRQREGSRVGATCSLVGRLEALHFETRRATMNEKGSKQNDQASADASDADACRAAAVEKLVENITNEWRRDQAARGEQERVRFNLD
jgi:hypothetical protein